MKVRYRILTSFLFLPYCKIITCMNHHLKKESGGHIRNCWKMPERRKGRLNISICHSTAMISLFPSAAMRIRYCIRQRVCAREYGIATSDSGRLPAARCYRHIFCGVLVQYVIRDCSRLMDRDLSKTLRKVTDTENVSY